MNQKQNLFIMGTFLGAMAFVLFLSMVSFAAPPNSPVIPPAWSQTLEASKRFVLVLNDEAVLDKETGLVWEKSPDTTTRNWYDAVSYCYTKNVGKRMGWRLPTFEELNSLVDREQQMPSLPIGHPFSNIQFGGGVSYWTKTTYVDLSNPNGTGVNLVQFTYGGQAFTGKTGSCNYWCVRGGHGYDAY
jgi:hypothetical protein